MKGLRGRFFDTSYGNDECPRSDGAVTENSLVRVFYCAGVPDQPKYVVWERARQGLDYEDAVDAVWEMDGDWRLLKETDSDSEFDDIYRRIKGMRGFQGSRSRRAQNKVDRRRMQYGRRGARPGMIDVRELELYADNEEPLYRQKRSIEQNLVRKLAAGTYDRRKAVAAFKYYADAAAQRYTREFGTPGRSSFGTFSVKEREALAKREERQFFARVKAGDKDLLDFVPKKYKKSKLCEVRRTNGTFKLDCNITLHGLRSRRRRR